jgi:competence protein ComEC
MSGLAITKTQVFIGLCLVFTMGIFLASKVSISNFWVYGMWLSLGIIWLIRLASKHTHGVSSFVILGLWVMTLGMWRLNIADQANIFEPVFNTQQSLEGVITEDIDIREDKQLIRFQPNYVQQQILITTHKTQEFFYGDYLLVVGQIKSAKNFDAFDYQAYLERYNIYGVMAYPKILILKTNRASKIKFWLLKVKQSFTNRLGKFLPEPQNSLALGVLIGAKRGLPSGLLENFNRSGTSHIVAVSGYNIAIIVSALSILAWVLGRRLSFWVSLLFICSFVIVAGASPSVIRAGVMGMLLLLGFKIGRLYSVIPALMFAGVLMLWINPKILLADIGFQLSFCATLGIILFMPLWEELAKNWPKLAGLKSIFFVSVSAIFATLPITLPTFSQLSLVALPANLLVLPAVPLAMLFGFLTVLPITAPGFAFLANGFLTYILLVVEKLGQSTWAVWSVKVGFWGQVGLWAIVGLVYGLLKYWALKKTSKNVKLSCK